MNKKDIIIIAVLLNTGLLSALAMMAINTSDLKVESEMSMEIAALGKEADAEKEPPIVAQNSMIATDEWDSVLKDYVTSGASDYAADDFEKEPELPKKQLEEKIAPKEVVQVQKEVIPQKPVQKDIQKEVVQQKPVVVEKTQAPKPASNKSVGKTIEITVKRGDALEKIARANGVTIDHIRALNNLKSDRLTIGQVLLVPAPAEKPAESVTANPAPKNEASTAPKNQAPDEIEYYVIRSGDNPWKIAKQFKVKFDDLLKLNHLDEDKARNLKIGDRIRVK